MKYMFIHLFFLLIFFCTSCSSPQKEKGSNPDENRNNQSNAQKITKIITIKPRYLSEKKSKVYYKPYRNVKRSTYETWIFSSFEFVKKVGHIKKMKTVKVKVEIQKKEIKRKNPKNPNVQSPHGGFRYIIYQGKIIEVVE